MLPFRWFVLLTCLASTRAGFVVNSGSCTVSGTDSECVQSPNYPGLYFPSDSCSISWSESVTGYIDVVYFSTESGYDFLTVNANEYSGSGSGLDGTVSNGELTWSSDVSNQDYGWKVCLTGYSDDSSTSTWSWVISGTGCSADSSEMECLESRNYPGGYSNDDSCSAYMSDWGTAVRYLEVSNFVTEASFDYLNVGSDAYSGTGSGLNGASISSQTITWLADGSNTYAGWRICARDELGTWYIPPTTTRMTTTYDSRRRSYYTSTTTDEDDSSSSISSIIPLFIGGPLLLICGFLAFAKWKKRQQEQSQSVVVQAPIQTGPTPNPVIVGSSPSSSAVGASRTTLAADNGALTISVQCGQCRALVQIAMADGEHLQYTCPSCGTLNQFSVTSPEDKVDDVIPEAEVPSYWTTSRGSGKSGFVTETDSTKRALQTLLDKTWKNQITRDRPRGSKVQKFEVVMVHRNENFKIWDSYARTRRQIEEISDGCDEWAAKTSSEEIYQDQDAADFLNRAELKTHCNEFFLFHGTKPSAAKAICDTDFLLKLSGSNAGTLYGPGLYFAEASSKSDEYAEEDKDGIFSGLYAMLVCRVVCGNINYTDQVRPKVQDLVDSILTHKTHHAVLGDREKCRGTYREFIIFDKDQVYPEFAIIYRRVDAEEPNDTE